MSPNTRPIGAGTCNLGLNMTVEERALLGRFACENNASLNQTLQELALRGLQQIEPALAAEIANIRQARGMVVKLGKAATCVALAGLLALFGSEVRRASRSLRVRRDEVAIVFA